MKISHEQNPEQFYESEFFLMLLVFYYTFFSAVGMLQPFVQSLVHVGHSIEIWDSLSLFGFEKTKPGRAGLCPHLSCRECPELFHLGSSFTFQLNRC